MEANGRAWKRPHWITGVALPGVPPTTPDPAPPPAGSEELSDPPEFASTPFPWSGLDSLGLDRLGLDRLGLDRLGLDQIGLTQSIGGLVLGLIALFSSYDHITFAGRSIPLQQQWGIPFIFASLATVFTWCVQYGAPLGRDSQLATRSRLRAANEREVDRNRADQERNRAAVDEVGRRPWRENARLRTLNAKTKTLLSYVDQHWFPPESNSIPIPPIETGSCS
jgi:hypothetical protein